LAATKRIQHPNIDSAFILKNGTFGYNSVGSIPIRDIPEMGSFIKDGNLDIYDMKGILKDEDEPYLENPSKGYLGFANNKFASDNYEFRSTLHEIVTGRAFRLEKFIK
jgi:acyl-homoserine lactone acylase PvdQ